MKERVNERAKLLTEWRSYFGLTQTELAKKVGRQLRTISNWESGRNNYSVEWVSGQLGLTVDQFLSGHKEHSANQAIKSAESTKQPQVPTVERTTITIPNLLVRLFMLSEIGKSIPYSPVEGFTIPAISVQDINDVIIVRIDIPIACQIEAKRIHVSLTIPQSFDETDILLVFDKNKNRADFIYGNKIKPHHFCLGILVCF